MAIDISTDDEPKMTDVQFSILLQATVLMLQLMHRLISHIASDWLLKRYDYHLCFFRTEMVFF